MQLMIAAAELVILVRQPKSVTHTVATNVDRKYTPTKDNLNPFSVLSVGKLGWWRW